MSKALVATGFLLLHVRKSELPFEYDIIAYMCTYESMELIITNHYHSSYETVLAFPFLVVASPWQSLSTNS